VDWCVTSFSKNHDFLIKQNSWFVAASLFDTKISFCPAALKIFSKFSGFVNTAYKCEHYCANDLQISRVAVPQSTRAAFALPAENVLW
jgi:hypothetical protein